MAAARISVQAYARTLASVSAELVPSARTSRSSVIELDRPLETRIRWEAGTPAKLGTPLALLPPACTVYAIWLPMLAGDSRGAWDAHVLDDPRVVSLWDGSRHAGKWFADRSLGGLGGPGNVVWDAYYAFAKNAGWQNAPSGLLAAGSDIIDNTSGLEHNFIPQLTGSYTSRTRMRASPCASWASSSWLRNSGRTSRLS